MSDPSRRRSAAPGPRRWRRRTLAGGAAALLAVAAVTAPVGARTPHLTRADAVRLADRPLLLRAVGPVTVQSALVRPVAAWGPPRPIGLAPTALVWHVTFSGWFRLFPCVLGPVPTATRPALLCAGVAAASASRPAKHPAVIACPALPRWPIPPAPCFGSWHRTATVSIADADGAWLGATYGPALPLGRWASARVIDRPRNGQTVVLTLGQLLLLGPPAVPTGGQLSPYRSSDHAVLAPIPPIPPVAAGTTAFLAEHPGSADVTAMWHPVCPAGQACPQYVLLVTVHVRVLLPVDLPPTP